MVRQFFGICESVLHDNEDIPTILCNMPASSGTLCVPPPGAVGFFSSRLRSVSTPSMVHGDACLPIMSVWAQQYKGTCRGHVQDFDSDDDDSTVPGELALRQSTTLCNSRLSDVETPSRATPSSAPGLAKPVVPTLQMRSTQRQPDTPCHMPAVQPEDDDAYDGCLQQQSEPRLLIGVCWSPCFIIYIET